MTIDTSNRVSISEACQNFSKVAQMADEHGSVVIVKDNVPRYILMELSQSQATSEVSDEDLMASSEKLMQRNLHVYEELAK